ncbi:unnamed protein product [Notodromas monacha]|uniref:Uncharacterized protein n=1 Tax=Notodromas monacha TaxID=399045 RepID=A0A7R9GL90_9CRUS|nr:unnamed protein product [Notodromas monacha]CAG0924660.1 unnamed protein product [Notodromas monacha]
MESRRVVGGMASGIWNDAEVPEASKKDISDELNELLDKMKVIDVQVHAKRSRDDVAEAEKMLQKTLTPTSELQEQLSPLTVEQRERLEKFLRLIRSDYVAEAELQGMEREVRAKRAQITEMGEECALLEGTKCVLSSKIDKETDRLNRAQDLKLCAEQILETAFDKTLIVDSADLNAGIGASRRYFVEGISYVQRMIDGLTVLSFQDAELVLGPREALLRCWEADTKLNQIKPPTCHAGFNAEILIGSVVNSCSNLAVGLIDDDTAFSDKVLSDDELLRVFCPTRFVPTDMLSYSQKAVRAMKITLQLLNKLGGWKIPLPIPGCIAKDYDFNTNDYSPVDEELIENLEFPAVMILGTSMVSTFNLTRYRRCLKTCVHSPQRVRYPCPNYAYLTKGMNVDLFQVSIRGWSFVTWKNRLEMPDLRKVIWKGLCLGPKFAFSQIYLRGGTNNIKQLCTYKNLNPCLANFGLFFSGYESYIQEIVTEFRCSVFALGASPPALQPLLDSPQSAILEADKDGMPLIPLRSEGNVNVDEEAQERAARAYQRMLYLCLKQVEGTKFVVNKEQLLFWMALPTPIEVLSAYSQGRGRLDDFGHLLQTASLIFAKYHCLAIWRGIRCLPGYGNMIGRGCSGGCPIFLDDGSIQEGIISEVAHQHSGSFGPVINCIGPLLTGVKWDSLEFGKYDYNECFTTDVALLSSDSSQTLEVGDIVKIRDVPRFRIIVSRSAAGVWSVGLNGRLFSKLQDVSPAVGVFSC